MRIGIVGGVERGWTLYERMATERGHSVEFHYGHPQGRGMDNLENLVLRSDILVILTGINSHTAVQHARKLVRKHDRRLMLVRSFGVARFTALLDELDAEARAAQHPPARRVG